jgi:hypothetical protein
MTSSKRGHQAYEQECTEQRPNKAVPDWHLRKCNLYRSDTCRHKHSRKVSRLRNGQEIICLCVCAGCGVHGPRAGCRWCVGVRVGPGLVLRFSCCGLVGALLLCVLPSPSLAIRPRSSKVKGRDSRVHLHNGKQQHVVVIGGSAGAKRRRAAAILSDFGFKAKPGAPTPLGGWSSERPRGGRRQGVWSLSQEGMELATRWCCRLARLAGKRRRNNG